MRALTVFVIVMGVVIIVGFGVVAAIVAGRMSRGERPVGAAAAGRTFATSLDLPRGARIEAMTTAPDRLILQLARPDGNDELVVLDLATGASLGTIELRPAR
ncbi:MAG TPA: DUF6476 family protein [Stellaceae bacterium]|jgi:choline dehydrogenase-like flavoprotein